MWDSIYAHTLLIKTPLLHQSLGPGAYLSFLLSLSFFLSPSLFLFLSFFLSLFLFLSLSLWLIPWSAEARWVHFLAQASKTLSQRRPLERAPGAYMQQREPLEQGSIGFLQKPGDISLFLSYSPDHQVPVH